MDAVGLDGLTDAIRRLHGCEATWLESVRVTEVHQGGEIIWQGEVQVFEVKHPDATRAYAWSYVTDAGERELVAVLGRGRVTDPDSAVGESIREAKDRTGRWPPSPVTR